MSGIQVTEELQKKGMSIPVILITGNANNLPETKLADLGIQDVLEKPFSPSTLAESLENVISRGPAPSL